tara:strand:- start:8 stop:460 length:453 start_codon:yes stop_codon:yes gene_type:complete
MIKIDTDFLERLFVVLICIVLSLIYLTKTEEEVKEEFVINEDSFEIFPLIAWKSTHKKWDGQEGDIVKIKYRVTNRNTKLWIYDVKTHRLVHEQPLIRDPWPDGRHRDFTYVWKLYKTERSRYIPSGEYEIRIGGLYEGGFGNLKTRIKI